MKWQRHLRSSTLLHIEQTLELIDHVDLSEAVLIIKLNHEALVNISV